MRKFKLMKYCYLHIVTFLEGRYKVKGIKFWINWKGEGKMQVRRGTCRKIDAECKTRFSCSDGSVRAAEAVLIYNWCYLGEGRLFL